MKNTEDYAVSVMLLVVAAVAVIAGAAGCTTYENALPFCFWNDVGAVDTVPNAPEPTAACLRVRAPDSARVSAEPIDACDADVLGADEVTVPAGELVYRYSYPDVTPGVFKASWVECP